MEVVGHYDELVQKNFVLVTVTLKRVEEEVGKRFGAEDRTTLPGDGGDEESADLLWGEHVIPGLKPLHVWGGDSPR